MHEERQIREYIEKIKLDYENKIKSECINH